MSQPLVLIAGAFGHGNVGDDAIAMAQCRLLREIEPEARVVVLGGDPQRTRQTTGEEGCYLSWRSPVRAASLIRLIGRCDGVLIGGGGLLSDRLHFYRPYVLLALLAQAMGKPVMFYSVGAYPPSTPLYRMLAHTALDHATAITVRDAFSARSVAAAGVRRRITVTADPAIILRPPAERIVRFRRSNRPLIGVSLRPMHDAPALMPTPGHLAAKLASCLDAIVARAGADLRFVPMHFGNADDDAHFQTAVIGQMKKLTGIEVGASQRPLDALRDYAGCDLVLGMRLHSNILAAAAGVPSVAIGYDPKVREFMRQLGGEHRMVNVTELEPDDLAERVERLLDEREDESSRVRERVEEMTISARSCALTAARLAGFAPRVIGDQQVAIGARN